MARIRNGILGGFSNKVGEVIGQNYAGVSTMRAMPKYVANPRTPAQVVHRELYSDLARIMKNANYILMTTLWNNNKVYNGFNKAMKYNWKNAVFGGSIDLSLLVFGEVIGGDFDKLDFSYVIRDDVIDLDITWDSVVNDTDKFADDQAICVVIHEKAGKPAQVLFAEYLAQTRGADGTKQNLTIPLISADLYDNADYLHIYWGVWSPETWGVVHNTHKSITIPAHNIPAFKPKKSFVSEVKKNNGIKS